MKILLRISLSLLIFISVLGILDYFIGDESFIQDYIRGTITETIGIILTIILIELILGQNRKNENLENAKKILVRTNNIINIYLTDYNESAYYLSYKYEDYETQKNVGLEESFPFTNLSELFHPSRSGFPDPRDTKVSSYFVRLDNLKEIIKTGLFQIDLTYFPELSILLQNYLIEVEKFYPKETILCDYTSRKIDGVKASNYMMNEIKNYEGKAKYSSSNFILNPYIRLYELIKYHISFNKEYKKLIEKYIK
jgi:hypothetical protein